MNTTDFSGREHWDSKKHSHFHFYKAKMGYAQRICAVPGTGVFLRTEEAVHMLATMDQVHKLRMSASRVAWMSAVVRCSFDAEH